MVRLPAVRAIRRLPAITAAAVLLVTAAAGCGSSSDGIPVLYEGNGVHFAYPSGWEEHDSEEGRFTENLIWDIYLAAGSDSFVNVMAFSVPEEVTTDNLGLHRESLLRFFEKNAEAIGATLEGGLVRTAVAGLPGYRYRIDRPDEGLAERNTVFFARVSPDESIEYLVKCVSTPDSWEVIAAGCERILDSFALDDRAGS